MVITVAYGQGLIFRREENYEHYHMYSVCYTHCSITEASTNNWQLNITTLFPSNNFDFRLSQKLDILYALSDIVFVTDSYLWSNHL